MVAKQSDAVNTSNEGAPGAETLHEELARLRAHNAELVEALKGSHAAHQADVGAIAQIQIPESMRKIEERIPAQFKRSYSHGGVVGPGKLWACAPYNAEPGDIVLLPKSEASRILREEPGVIEVDRAKFEDRIVQTRERREDKNGRRQWQTVDQRTPVKELLEAARPAGGVRMM